MDGVPYRFHDDDLSVFGRIGIDISLGDSVQSYIAVRSSDREAIAAQAGFIAGGGRVGIERKCGLKVKRKNAARLPNIARSQKPKGAR